MMKKIFFAMFAAAGLLLGLTGCSKEDKQSPADLNISEQDLIGLWWDEFKYSDVTESGKPFSRVLLAVKADADHTGCIYLGVFDDTSDEPLAVYGGPEEAGFVWRLLPDGRLQLSDPVSGEDYVMTRGDSNYGENMTDVSSTNMTYTSNSVAVTNGSYSGTLVKAGAEKETEIRKKLTMPPLTPNTNLNGEDDVSIDDTPQGGWGR